MKIFNLDIRNSRRGRALALLAVGFATFAFALFAVRAVSNSHVIASVGPVAAVVPATNKHSAGPVHYDILAQLLVRDRLSAGPDRWLRDLAEFPTAARVATDCHPLLGNAPPDFTLCDANNVPRNLHAQLSKGPVVLVFYLGYFCNVCVQNLLELNADLDHWHHLGAEVIAVSGDEAEFTRAQCDRFGAFRFPVLADPGHAVAESFSAYQRATATQDERLLHATFLIGRAGRVMWVHAGDTPFSNAKALQFELAQIERKLP